MDYSQSTAVPADQTNYDPKRLRWNREQECENYGAEKDNQGKDDREKGKELRGKPETSQRLTKPIGGRALRPFMPHDTKRLGENKG